MSALFLILIIIGCIGLILFVLVQNPKGGGLNSEFGSAVQLGGAKRATDILEKGTWGLAIALAVICLAMAQPGTGNGDSTEIEANPDSVEQFDQPDAGSELPAQPIGPGM
ncbi:MAG: preprotein translocase subunit SecG [Crocinitomicaceae bacterium]